MLHPNLVPRAALALLAVLALLVVGCASSRPTGPVDVEDLFTRLHLELRAAWREGSTVVLDIKEERNEAAVSVLTGFDAWLAGDAVYLTPRYGGGTSGRRQRFRVPLAKLGELTEGWRERVWLVVGDDLQPLPPGVELEAAPSLRQRIVLGARSLN